MEILEKQPQITTDFLISSNHVYAFYFLSILGFFSFIKKKNKILFIYLFFISIFLEFLHILIPNRSFEYFRFIWKFFGVIV